MYSHKITVTVAVIKKKNIRKKILLFALSNYITFLSNILSNLTAKKIITYFILKNMVV